eukprot:555506_1
MATTFIYFVAMVLFLSCVESMRLLGCFRCFGPKVHPSPDTELSGFDNCLLSFDSSAHANYSNADTTPPLTPRSYMVSEMQSQHGGFDIKSLYDKTELSPDNVNWFGVDSRYIAQNNTIIESNMNIYLITITVFDIVHVMYFLGHYLSHRSFAPKIECENSINC